MAMIEKLCEQHSHDPTYHCTLKCHMHESLMCIRRIKKDTNLYIFTDNTD